MAKIALQVEEMSCGGCAKSVEKIILKRDPEARVIVDLGSGRVEAETSALSEDIAQDLSAGGFPARSV